MKIAIVTPEHPNSLMQGGIARYLRDYLPCLAQECKVVLVSFEDGEAIEGVEQIIVSPSFLPSPFAPTHNSRRVVKTIRGCKVDLVEYTNWCGLGCADTGPWARVVRLSTPVVNGSLRSGILPKIARPLHHHWERSTVSKAHLWISHSSNNLQKCREVYGHHPPSEVIPLGVDILRHQPPYGREDILFVGRLEQRKGVDTLLHAWKLVVASPNYKGEKLHLVGRDMPGIGGSYLQECLDGSGCPKNNLIVHGQLSQEALALLREKCIISVVPSRYESFGMVALEAFGAGHAVIASRTGGLQEVVEGGKSGLVFTPGDVGALAEAILLLLRNNNLRATLVHGGQDALQNRFSIKQMVSESLRAYDKVLSLSKK